MRNKVTVHACYRLLSFALSGLYSGCRNLSGGLRRPAMRSFGPSGLITRERLQNKTIFISLILIVFCGMGCGVRQDKAELAADDPAAQIKQLRKELADKRSEVEKLNKQLTALRGFTADRMEYLVCVDRVKFGRFTRGYDENKDGIDEGINVYIVLNDKLGDKIKAAGEVGIELWDLAADEGRRLIQKRRYGLSEVADHWLSGFMTDHYKFKLEWSKEKRPSHPNLTLKLNFKEALTGNVFEIQKLITVK